VNAAIQVPRAGESLNGIGTLGMLLRTRWRWVDRVAHL